MADLACDMLNNRPGKYEITPDTRAQLERIAFSDQPSEPTKPTTTALAPGRSARRADEHLRSSGNGGQAAEVSQ